MPYLTATGVDEHEVQREYDADIEAVLILGAEGDRDGFDLKPPISLVAEYLRSYSQGLAARARLVKGHICFTPLIGEFSEKVPF